jgi:PilZ domain
MSNQNIPDPGVAGCATPGADRRLATRFSSIRAASCSPLAERETVLPVCVRDVSANGIGFLSTRRFERGTILLLQLQEEGDVLSPLLVGKVVHVCAEADGDWLIGCSLTRALAQADVHDLADKTAEAS